MDNISRITPPVSKHEQGDVHKHIITAIQRARNTNSYVVVEKVFKEAYALYNEYEDKMNIHLSIKKVINVILLHPDYTPLHGMVMACLYAAFGQNDEALELLLDNVKDQLEYVYFKPIIDYYRSKRLLDDYADKERIEYTRNLKKRDEELENKFEEYERQIKQLKEENDTLRGALPSKQENIFTLEDILDYMLSTKKIEFCGQIATMLNHFSRSLTEDGWKQVLAVENELRNGSLINMVNHNHIEGSNVIQGVINDSKFSK